MNEMKMWAAGICLAILGSVLLESLVPAGEMKKLFSFLLSVIVLLMILKPILGLSSQISDYMAEKQWRSQEQTDPQIFSDYVDQQMVEAVQTNIEELAKKELYERNLPYKNIVAVTDIDENGSILINKLIVECDWLYEEEIRQILSEKFKLPTEVITDDA